MTWECIDCGETDINLRLTAQSKKCLHCKSRPEYVRGHENEPAWDVELSLKFRREYEQRQCATTEIEKGFISNIFSKLGQDI